MFGIGPTELIVILVLALIVVGPERLPTLAGQIGKAIRDFRQMSGDMTGEFQRAFQLEEETPAENTSVPAETVLPWATPDGNGADVPALAAQVIDPDPVIEPVAEPAASETAPVAEATPVMSSNGSHATTPVATKADPLLDVSFLDDPEEVVAVAATANTTESVTEGVTESTTTFESQPVATFGAMPAIAEETVAAPAVDPIADAWSAVMTTEATISLPEPSATEAQAAEAQATGVETAVAVAEPPAVADDAPTPFAMPKEDRPQINAADEISIREVIESQVAAEAFRERRRVATYRRHK